jgi:hypothetical protein
MTKKAKGLLHVRPRIMQWNKHMKPYGKRAFWKVERLLERKECAQRLHDQ